MKRALVVTDAAWVSNAVHAALPEPDYRLVDLDDPAAAASVAVAESVDVVVVDLQVGAMGGMAVTRLVRDETGSAADPGIPVVILLDRAADSFLAKRAGARAWVTKPFSAHEIRTAIDHATAASEQPAAP